MRPLANCGSISASGNVSRSLSETVPTSPFNWKAGRFCSTAFRERVMGSFAGVDAAPGFDRNGSSNFFDAVGFSTGGLKGIFDSSGENGKGVGTGGPLEAGTLPAAEAPVPFGKISNGVFKSVRFAKRTDSSGGELGASGSFFDLSSGE